MSATSMKNHRAWVLLAVVMISCLVFGAMLGLGQGPTSRYPPWRKKAPTTKAEPRSTVIASGEVRPIRYVTVTSEVAGRIQKIYADIGERVTKGQALVLIDSSQQAQPVAQNKATQVSPLNGIVADIPVRAGEAVVGGQSGTPLMMIADMSAIYVEVNVDETEISKVKVGQQARITVDAFGEKEIRGLVTYKNPRAVSTSDEGGLSRLVNDQEAKEFKVTVELRVIPAGIRNRLLPGMSATATITTKTKNRARK
jgi:multidrug efflux pump subunit AcrA (membrane-fusion protein)